MAGPLGVQARQLRMRQIERNGDRHRAERHAPLARQVEARPHPADVRPLQLAAEFLDDRRERRALDAQSEVADRAGREVGLLESGLHQPVPAMSLSSLRRSARMASRPLRFWRAWKSWI